MDLLPAVPRLHRTGPALCPVTALAFFHCSKTQPASSSCPSSSSSLYVLAAEDNHLAVYPARADAAQTAPCCGRVRIFAEQAIHGCFVGDREEERSRPAAAGDGGGPPVLVWGGQNVALVSRARIVRVIEGKADPGDDDENDDGVLTAVAPDWIHDGRLLRDGQRAGGALVTAHNEVIPFWTAGSGDGDNGSQALHLAAPDARIAPSRPMLLYSARLAWVNAAEVGADDDDDDNDNNNSNEDDDRPPTARLLVAAGTVFGEIVVWTCRVRLTTASQPDPQVRLRGVFTGHEGSIFDVALSSTVALSGAAAAGNTAVRVRLMATCSDDRTIRIWPLVWGRRDDNNRVVTPQEAPGASVASVAHAARETGFQNTTFTGPTTAAAAVVAEPPSSSSATDALAVAMGHVSRIWHVRFGGVSRRQSFDNHAAEDLLLYSFGEDAMAQVWRCTVALDRVRDNGALVASLVPLRTVAGHVGKSLWSAAVTVVGDGADGADSVDSRTLVATGGCDGRIGLFSGQDDTSAADADQRLLTTSTVPETTQGEEEDGDENTTTALTSRSRSSRAHDTFVSYAFLAPDRLLATTSRGRLLIGRLDAHGDNDATLHWDALPGVPATTPAVLQGYSVVRSLCGGGGGRGSNDSLLPADTAIVGSADGRLFLYAHDRLEPLATRLPGKVDEVFFLPAPSPSTEPGAVALSVLVTGLFYEEAMLLDIEVAADVGTPSPLVRAERQQRLLLPRSAQKPLAITAASCCCGALVVGFKNGRLGLYHNSRSSDGRLALVAGLQRASRDAILAIVPMPVPEPAFVVTARDGTYRIYAIETKTETETAVVRLRLRHETAPPFGPIVRDAWFVHHSDDTDSPDLVLCGFRSTQFVVWNETRQRELAAVDCGGTHRAHAYCYETGQRHRLRFAFTRSGRLCVFSQDVDASGGSNTANGSSSTLKPGGHGREIRAVCASAGGTYLATGGEDTVVRIWGRWGQKGPRDRPLPPCLAVLKRHNTGLHALAWLGDDCLVSAAGAEELYVWRLTRLGGDDCASQDATTTTPSTYKGLAVLCEASYPLMIDSRTKARADGATTAAGKPDSREKTGNKILRITALDATAMTDGSALISVALSNSVLKTYRYTPPNSSSNTATASGTWVLLAQGRYTGACPTALHHLSVPSSVGGGGDRDLVVLAGFADGHLTVWRAARGLPRLRDGEDDDYDDYVFVSATQVHRNAIKSLVVQTLSASRLTAPTTTTVVVVTGGDDNALAVTGLTWPGRSSGSGDERLFHKTYRVARAHAAAVTGIQLLGEEKGADEKEETVTGQRRPVCRFRVMSCSNDQRLKAWQILVSSSSGASSRANDDNDDTLVRVQLLDDQYSAIADPGDMEGVQQAGAVSSVVVVGMGMETWQLG